MCIIIGKVHKFNGHCLIPLDPWLKVNMSSFKIILSIQLLTDHPDFLTFRLQELDEELRGAADKGKGAKDGEGGEDGSGDDPQQVIIYLSIFLSIYLSIC